jgi:hypothetical protein
MSQAEKWINYIGTGRDWVMENRMGCSPLTLM